MTKSNLPPAFIISGTHSGVGKTTVSYGLMATFSDLGYKVQPFKIGPDFIDANYHFLATSRNSINIDLWLMGEQQIIKSFKSFSSDADLSIIEGMGALFDGENGVKDKGSAAYMAKLLDIPVVLVMDVWGLTRTAHAIIKGMMEFDPNTNIIGIILNRTGSHKHYQMILDSLPPHLKSIIWGHVLYNSKIEIPERHLGLLTVEENQDFLEKRTHIVNTFKESINLDLIKQALDIKKSPTNSKKTTFSHHPKKNIRLAIAKDNAFCFYYQENLIMLETFGAELVYFSPVEDKEIPADINGMYIGGGYPESFARELADNHSMRNAIKNAADMGMPIYAECGGFIYLGHSLIDFDHIEYPMVSIFPATFQMDKNFLSIKYVEIRTTELSIFGDKNLIARGQEFHQSRITSSGPDKYCFSVTSSTGETFHAGHIYKNVLGSYIHLHFSSNPILLENFILNCMQYQKLRGNQ